CPATESGGGGAPCSGRSRSATQATAEDDRSAASNWSGCLSKSAGPLLPRVRSVGRRRASYRNRTRPAAAGRGRHGAGRAARRARRWWWWRASYARTLPVRQEGAGRGHPSLAGTCSASNVPFRLSRGAGDAGGAIQLNWHEKRTPASTAAAWTSLARSVPKGPKGPTASILAGIDFQYLQVWTAMKERPAKWALLACGGAQVFNTSGFDRDEHRFARRGCSLTRASRAAWLADMISSGDNWLSPASRCTATLPFCSVTYCATAIAL